MIYIKLENELDECDIKFSFIKKKIFKLKNKYSKLKEERFENIILITLPNLENYTLNKLSKYMRVKCVNRVCISENLSNNLLFMEFIKNEDVRINDGKWLFKYLSLEVAEYICQEKKELLAYQEISILCNKVDFCLESMINDFANRVRVLNIITKHENKFKKIEKKLYEEKGIILNVNDNYKKSLIKSDIIFNYDFSEDEINKYIIPKKTCIINFERNIRINSKSFEGINPCFLDINMPRKYLKNSIILKGFNNSCLYESYIYKKTIPENIKCEIKEDEISILFLIGKNGKIRKNEYLNLSKKIAN